MEDEFVGEEDDKEALWVKKDRDYSGGELMTVYNCLKSKYRCTKLRWSETYLYPAHVLTIPLLPF